MTAPPAGRAPDEPPTGPAAARAGARRPLVMKALYIRVIVVQAFTLAALWLLQSTFGLGG